MSGDMSGVRSGVRPKHATREEGEEGEEGDNGCEWMAEGEEEHLRMFLGSSARLFSNLGCEFECEFFGFALVAIFVLELTAR